VKFRPDEGSMLRGIDRQTATDTFFSHTPTDATLMGGDAPVTPRYGDGYGAVSPAGARYKANPQPAKVAGAAAAAASAVARPPLSARGDRLSLNMSPRWQAPQLTPRLHPDDIAAAVRQSSYIRARQVVPQAYRDIVPPLPPTPPPGARSSRTPDTAKEPAPLHETEAEAAPTSEQDSVPEPEPEPGSSEEAAPALKTAKLPDVNGYVYSTTESESEEEEDDEMDDEFDAQMLMMAQKRTKGGGGNAAGRRMSLADMQGSDMMAGMAVLRESLSEIEIEEYRDFFDLVDDDKSNSINATELKNVMVMMGMEAPDEQVKAMIGEVQDPAAMEMKFDEFLTLMAIFVGPRGDRQAEELQEAFNAIDDDGGGTIDREELSDAFKKYGEPVTDAECNELIEMADKEGKGEINIDEFKDMMMSALPKDATESVRC
jgi:Ca2+-binding EF-hand superfamily protein